MLWALRSTPPAYLLTLQVATALLARLVEVALDHATVGPDRVVPVLAQMHVGQDIVVLLRHGDGCWLFAIGKQTKGEAKEARPRRRGEAHVGEEGRRQGEQDVEGEKDVTVRRPVIYSLSSPCAGWPRLKQPCPSPSLFLAMRPSSCCELLNCRL